MNKLVALVGVLVATVMLACSGSSMGASLDLSANMDAPSSFCSSGGSMGERTAWVLSDEPQRLSLVNNLGQSLPCSQGPWQQTSKGYMAQVSFPSSYASDYNSLRLVREDGKGWSDWNKQDYNEMAYLRHSNVGKSDPACVGGRAWCAVRGL